MLLIGLITLSRILYNNNKKKNEIQDKKQDHILLVDQNHKTTHFIFLNLGIKDYLNLFK